MIDFTHSDEQQMIADSLDRLLLDNYPFTEHLVQAGSSLGYDESLWQQLCELGIAAILIPEEYDGLGGGAEDVMIIMEQVGKHLLISPLLASAIVGTTAIRIAATAKQKQNWLPALVNGEQRTALAINEPHCYGLPDSFDTKFADGQISGHKSVVNFGQCADYLIVAVQRANGQALCRVEVDAAGLNFREYKTHDGGTAVDIVFNNTPAELLGDGQDAREKIHQLWDLGAIAVCAEALGCMDEVYRQTRNYLKVREQFGATLASFQSLQYRLVELHMACELSRAITCEAVWAMDNASLAERHQSVNSAKILVAQHGNLVGKDGIQLHGGIGMTWELPIGHYFKRLMAIDMQFGDASDRLNRVQCATQ